MYMYSRQRALCDVTAAVTWIVARVARDVRVVSSFLSAVKTASTSSRVSHPRTPPRATRRSRCRSTATTARRCSRRSSDRQSTASGRTESRSCPPTDRRRATDATTAASRARPRRLFATLPRAGTRRRRTRPKGWKIHSRRRTRWTTPRRRRRSRLPGRAATSPPRSSSRVRGR